MPSVQAVIGSFIIVIALMLGVMVVDSLATETGTSGGDAVTRQAAVFEDDGEYIRLNDGRGTNQTVYKTTGYAVNLTGASDSYIQSDAEFSIASDDNWTVSVWAYVDQGAPQDMAAVSANGRVTITLNRTQNQWQGWYYDDGSMNSYTANVSTSGNEVGNLTNVMVWHNGTHLQIYRNNTLGDTVATTGTSNVDSAPVSADNWDGRLEELRTFDKALNATERNTIVNSPVEQLPDSSPTARAMFDQPQKSTQLLLYTNTHLTQSNVTYSDGFGEQVMQGDGNLIGADYRWQELGPEIAPIAGSELGGAPVAYASYDLSARGAANVVDSWSSFTSLASMLPLVLIGAAIVALLSRVQG